ncbi:MAG: coproporphyrinogen-III oxidase family protein [Bryobacteraceae bacterium]
MPGVYISYPFCAQKCTYCNFASGVFPLAIESQYLAALHAEIGQQEWLWRPETVYLGGGTPSALAPDLLADLLGRIPGRPWMEATIEAAPGSITVQKARVWVEAGVDRVSLGVQSFVQREINGTGRKHTPETVASDIKMLHDCGIRKINIDLIAGLPGQTEASWEQSLGWIADLKPDHVSVYMLEVDDDSRLGREILAGGSRYGATIRPSDELTADLYETAVERLRVLGIFRYEISNFARPGHESRHNLKYWNLESYAGFGADAHSFDGRYRWQNPESITDYLGAPRPERIEADPLEEHFFVGLRLARGIRPDAREWRHFGEPIRRFLEQGLLETDGQTLRLTDRGVMLSNEVFQEFVT